MHTNKIILANTINCSSASKLSYYYYFTIIIITIIRERKSETRRYIEREDADEFSVTSILIAMCNSPLQRNKVAVVNLDVVFAILSHSFLLGQTNAAVLERSENCCRNFVVVTLHTTATCHQPNSNAVTCISICFYWLCNACISSLL